MAKSQILNDLEAQVAETISVEKSAVTLINGIAARVQAAVDVAIAGGATAEELAVVQAEVEAMKASAADLSAAISANSL